MRFFDNSESLMDAEVERKVSVMQTVIDLTRILRDRKTLPTKVEYVSVLF